MSEGAIARTEMADSAHPVESEAGAARQEGTERAAGEPGGTEPPASVPTAPSDSPRIGFIPHVTIGAFSDDTGIGEALASAASDRRMSRTVVERYEGGLEAALKHFENSPTPDLIIAETRLAGDPLFAALAKLAERCPPGTRLILIGHDNDVALYRKLLKFGVGDYLVAPLGPLAVIDSISELFEESDTDRLGKVTAFFGARGGSGSSTVAQNVASAMARSFQSSVLLVDLDLAFGTAAFDLDLDPTQGTRDALEEGDRLDETLLDRLVTKRDNRLGLLASPANLEINATPEPEDVLFLIEKARTLTPHLLLDLPHSWSGAVRKALHSADEIVLTATPDLTSLRNARNLVTAARMARPNDPAPRLVLNQIGMPKRREASAEDFRRVLDLEPVATLAFDPGSFSEAATKGELLVELKSNGAAAQAFQKIASVLTGQKKAEQRKGRNGFSRLLKWSA